MIIVPQPVHALNLVTMDYPPYEYETDDQIKGIAVDIVTEIFDRMNRKIHIVVLPWARAIKLIETGRADAIFTIYKNQNRVQFADFSNQVLIEQHIALYVRKNSTIRFSGSLNDIKDQSLGLVRRFSYGETFDTALKQGLFSNVDYAATAETNMAKLLKKRFDVLVSDQALAVYVLNKMRKTNVIKQLNPVVQKVPSFIAFSKKRRLKSIRDRFDRVLKEMKQSGDYDLLLRSATNE